MIKRMREIIYKHKWAIIFIAIYFAASNLVFGYFCPSKWLLGLPCPACGLTRAALKIAVLDFKGAFALNPCIYAVIPLAIVYIYKGVKGESLKKLYLPTLAVAILMILVFAIRVRYNFGIEPLVINPDAYFFRLIRQN